MAEYEEGLLLEREAETDAVDAALGAAAAGDGTLLVIQGPPGIGKTALLESAVAAARRHRFVVLAARASTVELEYPFGIAQQLFAAPFSALPVRERRVAMEAAGPAASALGLSGPLEVSADQSFAVVHGLHRLLLVLAGDSPLLLVVDDAQWADLASLRFLNHLAGRLSDLPIALIVATRAAKADTDPILIRLLGLVEATVLEPAPLSAAGSAALLRRLQGEVSEGFARAAHDATGGNPLLLAEIARAAGSGLLDVQRTIAFDSVQLPTVARSVRSRLAALPAGAAPLCRAVAALGASANLSRAARVAGLPPDEAALLLDDLAAAEVLSSSPYYEFVHPLVRGAIFDDWPPGERAITRRRVAQVLDEDGEAERAALQLLEVPAGGDEWVLDVLRRGSVAASQRGASEAAWELLRRALDERPGRPQRAEILRDAAIAGRLAGKAEALDLLHEHIELLTEPDAVADAEIELGWWCMYAGRFQESLRLMDRHLDARSGEGDLVPESIALAASQLCSVDSVASRAGRLRERAAAATDPAPSAVWVLAALDAMAGNPAAAAAAAEAARDWLSAPRSPPPPNFIYLAFALTLTEQFRLEVEVFETAAEDARRSGAVPQFTLAATWAGWGALGRGDLAAADAHASAALAAGHLRVWGGISPAAVALLVEVRLAQGNVDDAERLLADHGMLPDMPDGFIFVRPRYTRGLVHVARDRLSEALEDFTDSGELASRHRCTTPGWIPWRSAAASVLIRKGERDAASRLLDEEVALARAAGLPAATATALRARAATARGEEAIHLYREAAHIAGDGRAPLVEGNALADLGAALRRRGQRVEARDPLRVAMDLAARCGATPLAERALQELLAAGARPRRTAVTGPDALTYSERRVAELAASARTNRQIADALVVSGKTVEKHLASAFRKLQITRRSELATALGERA